MSLVMMKSEINEIAIAINIYYQIEKLILIIFYKVYIFYKKNNF